MRVMTFALPTAAGVAYDAPTTKQWGSRIVSNAPAVGAGAGCVGRADSGSAFARPLAGFAALAIAMLLGTIAWLALTASPAAAAAPNSLGLSATYDVVAQVHWQSRELIVETTAHVTNTTNHHVGALTFNLVPLVTGDARILRVTVEGQEVVALPTGQTIVVALPRKLAPGVRTDVTIRYRGSFNAGTDSRRALFMHQDSVMTAYRWIPWLSRKQPFAAPNWGETWVNAVSPRVSVTFVSRADLKFATSGRLTSSGSNRQKFVATNVRDFNFSASPEYRIKTVRSNGVQVRIFYRDLPARALARYTVAALRRFDERVGTHPYRHLNVAEVPAGTGMESPGLTWIPSSTAANRLERLATHEVAHQWFYAAVGNNQARQPFLDEALAEFMTNDMLGTSRVPRCASDDLDRAVYSYSRKCYPEVIYVQGSRYLESYMTTVGRKSFWAGMRQFYRDYEFRIAGTRALLDTLDAASGYNSQLHEHRFPSLYP